MYLITFLRESQYKKHIVKWGLKKNVKGRDMLHIYREQKRRKTIEGKESIFYVRDRLVSSKKIKRFGSGRNLKVGGNISGSGKSCAFGILLHDVDEYGITDPLLPHIRCCTPTSDHFHERELPARRPNRSGGTSARRGTVSANGGSANASNNSGLDRGFPDLDVPQNNDDSAIKPRSSNDQDILKYPFNGGVGTHHYDFPLSIDIPRSLNPLPSTLKENPMNLLYFNHFLKHTASTLVAHDCADNPFRNILPKSKYVVISV